MRKARIVAGLPVCMAAIGLGVTPGAMAAADAPQPPNAVDVSLLEGGVLIGQVVDAQGAAVAHVPVVLRYQNRNVAVPTTGQRGYFAVHGMRAGVYQIAAADSPINNVGKPIHGRPVLQGKTQNPSDTSPEAGNGVYRLWASGTAPPTAQRGALVVSNGSVARGQSGGGAGMSSLMANPWVVAGVVANCVSVPVAVHNAQSHPPHSP